MEPLIIEEKPHNIRRKVIIILSIIVIIITLIFDYVFIFYNKTEIETDIVVGGLSREEIIKRRDLEELNRINSENPVSTSTKQSLLNDLNKLNNKTTSKIKK